MKITHKTSAKYLDHMGSDLTVVNAARESFEKRSDWAVNSPTPCERKLKDADANLIRFLATGYRTSEWQEFLDEIISTAQHGSRGDLTDLLHAYKRRAQHWAPFGHPHVQIHVSMPIFLARQFVKHQVGGVWSEASRRYISDDPGVYIPDEWHTRPEDIKQGSGGLVENQSYCAATAEYASEVAVEQYRCLLNEGVAPEEARMILPLNMMTGVTWTGSLLFWSRVVNQRVDSHAQLAAQSLAKQINDIVEPLFPTSWKALTSN